MESPEKLKIRIELARKRLVQLEMIYGLGHALVLKQSVRLDELINQYYRFGIMVSAKKRADV
ncbi:aspartyl-phosphate phosphatase Spo0E family protein [Paenibacillus macerans]|uniref:aspartyl-phosphate phosphatase Spo0E family protein n=1 Tax=Paenibacillus macerans TaxID=44252 RepID=UPI002041DD4B|nr:aspartyl-phosphate phosphatase Spo0E family protein [Paenibacillus macerans]MCM3702632.1 aspartyl-phosphate phosphatase Spo0E family protein [Paenibacillus macerans]